MSESNTRNYSSAIVDGVDRAPARSMLRAVGFTDEDFTKPQVGIASSPSDLTPCNICLLYTSPSPRDRTRSRMPSSA